MVRQFVPRRAKKALSAMFEAQVHSEMNMPRSLYVHRPLHKSQFVHDNQLAAGLWYPRRSFARRCLSSAASASAGLGNGRERICPLLPMRPHSRIRHHCPNKIWLHVQPVVALHAFCGVDAVEKGRGHGLSLDIVL